MKIGITGAPGHVGSTICRMMNSEDYQIKAMYYDDTKGIDALNIEKVQGDILDQNSISSFVKDCDVIIHLAAKISIDGDPDGSVTATNLTGTKNVIKACMDHQIKRLVHFSTIHAMNPFPLDEVLDETRELVFSKGSLYDQSKVEGELAVLKATENGLDAVVICPTSIVGPNDYLPSLMGHAVLDIYNNALPALVEGGYDWVDVRDIAKSTIAAITKGRSGQKYLLPGEFLTVKEVADLIGGISNKKVPQFVTPFWMAKLGVPFVKMQSKLTGKPPLFTNEALTALKHSNALISGEKAKKELGHTRTPIRKTLEDTLAWFKETGMIKELRVN